MLPLPTPASAVTARGPLPTDSPAQLPPAGQQLAAMMPSSATERKREQQRSERASVGSSQPALAIFLRHMGEGLATTPRGGLGGLQLRWPNLRAAAWSSRTAAAAPRGCAAHQGGRLCRC